MAVVSGAASVVVIVACLFFKIVRDRVAESDLPCPTKVSRISNAVNCCYHPCCYVGAAVFVVVMVVVQVVAVLVPTVAPVVAAALS